jgi:hypothetical protein
MLVCPSDGHAIDPHFADGPNCADHGVPFFDRCPTCRAYWPVVAKHNYMGEPDSGADFCATCTTPAPWLSRGQLLAWIQNQIRAQGMSGAIPRVQALELAELVQRLESMRPDDTNSVGVWKRVREMAPQVWAKVEPVAHSVIGEAVKRMLGL